MSTDHARRPLPIDPPELPDYFADKSPPHLYWDELANHFTARLNPETGQFDIRMINHQDPDGRFGPSDWPTTWYIGPPGEQPGWHPLLHKYGLQVMNAAGFINNEPDGKKFHDPKGRLADKYHADDPIHPIFREDMWHGLQDGDFAAMRHGLLLASAILDDPDTLRFFAGLLVPHEQMWAHAHHIGKYMIFEPTGPLTKDQLRKTYKAIKDMRMCIQWRLTNEAGMEEKQALGRAVDWYLDDGIPHGGIRPGTHGKVIDISEGYINAMLKQEHEPQLFEQELNNAQHSSYVSPERGIFIDPANAYLRCLVMFAQTLLHEFAHAFCSAYIPDIFIDDTNPDHPQPQRPIREPFRRGDRVNEIGYAFIHWIFGGSIRPTCWEQDLQNYTAPFGTYFTEKWDARIDDFVLARGQRTISEPDQSPQNLYPIMQKHIDRLFTKKVWERYVQRYGIDTIRLPHLPKWNVPF